jgi:hypothetical protein
MQAISDQIQRQGLRMWISMGGQAATETTVQGLTTRPTRPMTIEEYLRSGRQIPETPEIRSEMTEYEWENSYQILTSTEQNHDPQPRCPIRYGPDLISARSLPPSNDIRVEGVQKAKKRLEPRRRALPA